jgi:hypothetical protein
MKARAGAGPDPMAALSEGDTGNKTRTIGAGTHVRCPMTTGAGAHVRCPRWSGGRLSARRLTPGAPQEGGGSPDGKAPGGRCERPRAHRWSPPGQLPARHPLRGLLHHCCRCTADQLAALHPSPCTRETTPPPLVPCQQSRGPLQAGLGVAGRPWLQAARAEPLGNAARGAGCGGAAAAVAAAAAMSAAVGS